MNLNETKYWLMGFLESLQASGNVTINQIDILKQRIKELISQMEADEIDNEEEEDIYDEEEDDMPF